ncbi:MAG: hypothetical protein BJ554DRAFT_7362, partial [Olpidium bornovanus]
SIDALLRSEGRETRTLLTEPATDRRPDFVQVPVREVGTPRVSRREGDDQKHGPQHQELRGSARKADAAAEQTGRAGARLLAEREREPASTAPGNGDDADTSKIGLQSPGRSPSLSFLRDNKGIGFEMPDLGGTPVSFSLDNPFDLRLSLEGSQEGNESESDMNDVSMELSSCDGGIRTPVLNPRPLSSIEGELESPQLDDAMDETRPVGGIRAISDPLAQDHTDNISGLIDFGRPA